MASGPNKRAATIAIVAALVAVVISATAAIVVATRSAPAVADPSRGAKITHELRVPVEQFLKLRGEAARTVRAGGKIIGIKVVDQKLREQLGLGETDVIESIGGHAIENEQDVHDAIVGMSMMDAQLAYLELEGGKLVRVRLEGDLRQARHDADPDRIQLPPIDLGSSPGTIPDPYAPDPLLDTIERVDDTHVRVPRMTADKLLLNNQLPSGARIVPWVQHGKPAGLKLYAIRPNSLFAKLGFSNGDAIGAVNGQELDSMKKALDVYTQLAGSSQLRFSITRRGKPVELVIDIVP